MKATSSLDLCRRALFWLVAEVVLLVVIAHTNFADHVVRPHSLLMGSHTNDVLITGDLSLRSSRDSSWRQGFFLIDVHVEPSWLLRGGTPSENTAKIAESC